MSKRIHCSNTYLLLFLFFNLIFHFEIFAQIDSNKIIPLKYSRHYFYLENKKFNIKELESVLLAYPDSIKKTQLIVLYDKLRNNIRYRNTAIPITGGAIFPSVLAIAISNGSESSYVLPVFFGSFFVAGATTAIVCWIKVKKYRKQIVTLYNM